MTTFEPTPTSDFAGILTALIDGQPSEEQLASLESLLADDSEALVYYRKYMRLCALLEFERIKVEECEGHQVSDALAETESVPFKDAAAGHAILLPTFVTNAYQGVIGYFSQEIPFSLLISTIVTGLGLLVGSLVYVTHYKQVADGTHRSTPLAARAYIEFVGRVTGLADVQWADINTSTECGNGVPLGRKYTLSSGLLEIAYNTGAKVILQGPCTYEVESRDGGFLAIGKLTARLDNAKPQAADSKSSLSPLPSPLFTIKTPTAVVTDLGTEFGVEVTEEGTTTSHVFRGSVQVQMVSADADNNRQTTVLHQNESACVEKVSGSSGLQWKLNHVAANPHAFVRKLVQRPKILDLMDIVAGGDGTGHRRERGIDPATGMEDTFFLAQDRGGDPRKYTPVSWHKMVDGVFVVDGRVGATQLDSAGHKFAAFPQTRGGAFGSIWARAATVVPKDERIKLTRHWVYIIGRAKEYMPDDRGLLGLHPNAGITFNLAAIRQAHPSVRPMRFHAVCGAPRDYGLVDFWIFVDGQLKLNRMHVRTADGIIPVDIPLAPDSQFLTLVTTDGGNDYHGDGFVFGDAALIMTPNDEAAEGGKTR